MSDVSGEVGVAARQQLRDHRSVRVFYFLVLGSLMVVFLFSTQALTWKQGATMFTFGVLLSGASLISGGLIGFLFGIPRKLQASVSEVEAEASNAVRDPEQKSLYGANTNLEQISDWLTKILVGVGLTQISGIRDGLLLVGGFSAAGFGNVAGSSEFGVALVLLHLVSGFLLGYLWTRLHLGRALTAADETLHLRKQVDSLEEASRANATALRLVSMQLSLDHDPVAQKALNDAIKNASSDIRAAIYYRAYDQRWRNWKLHTTKPQMERTIPVFRALVNSDTARRFHLNHGQLGFALKDQRKPDWKSAAESLTHAIEIRGKPASEDESVYEFARAVCRIELDEEFSKGKPSSRAACAAILQDISVAQAWILENHPVEQSLIKKWQDLNAGEYGRSENGTKDD